MKRQGDKEIGVSTVSPCLPVSPSLCLAFEKSGKLSAIIHVAKRWIPLMDAFLKTSLLIVVSPIVVLFMGCNDGPRMYQISGKVTFKDGSVPAAGLRVVRFEPASDTTATIRKTASGEITDDGSFQLFTRKPGDGVIPGTYNVTFTIWKGPRNPISLIAEKFTASATTPYKQVRVDHDQDDLKFELEPVGKGPGKEAPTMPAAPAGRG